MASSRLSGRETGLKRRKSTASTVSRSAHSDAQRLDPEIAQQHAIAAANMAYQSNIAAEGIAQTDGTGPTADIPHHLRKTQSVRFFGPHAEQSSPRSITRRVAPNWDYLNRRKSRESFRKSPTRQATNLNRVDPNPHVSKSSYNKVRKSKSLFSPRKQYTEYVADSTPAPEHQQRHSRLSGSTEIAPPSTGRNVVTAEDILLGIPNPYQTSYDQDAAIQMAQDEYRRQVNAQYSHSNASRSQSNNTSAPVDGNTPRKKAPKMFRRTTRTTSGNQYGASVGSQPISETPRKRSFGRKARKISSSFKSRLKKAFGIKSDKSFPSQQVDAQRVHFNSFNNSSQSLTDGSFRNDRGLSPDDEFAARVDSRNSRRAQSAIQQHHSAEPSIIHHDYSEEPDQNGSRVTSWANSTTTNCTAPTSTSDNKRLTVINENEDAYQPSTSVNVGQTTAKSRYDAFRRPLKPGRVNEPVDSQAIYSALQRRIDESQSVHEKNRKSSNGSSRRSSFGLRRKSSQGPHKNTGATIRLVQSGRESRSSARHSANVSSSSLPLQETRGNPDDIFRPESARSIRHKRSNAQSSIRRTSRHSAIFSRDNEPKEEKRKSVRETRSTFFGALQGQPKPKALSPYRLAVRTSSKPKVKLTKKTSRRGLQGGSPNAESNDSDSLYSRHVTGTPSGLEAPLQSSSSHAALGTALVEDSQTIARRYSELIGQEPDKSRAPSNTSSDWRNWASTQTEGLQMLPEEVEPISPPKIHETSDGNADDAADTIRHPSNSTYQYRVASQHAQEFVTLDGSRKQLDFDYGFATSNALQHLKSQTPAHYDDGGDYPHSEVSYQYGRPLTERKSSHSNVLHYHIEQGRETLPSHRQQSSENARLPSSHLQQQQPASLHVQRASRMHKGSTGSMRRDSGNYAANTQTVVVRRRSPERSERSERLRRIQSSRSLCQVNDGNDLNRRKHGSRARRYDYEDIDAASAESVYGISGSGILGPLMTDVSRDPSPAFL